MPPRKKAAVAKAATLPLDSCSIAISGTFPNRTQAAIERDFITVLGGSLAKSITASTTHLVTTEADYNKPSNKVKAARSYDVPIVTFEWLEDSLNKMSRMSEDSYSFEPPQSQPSQTNGSRKRTATQEPAGDSDNDDETQSQAKKKSKTSKVKAQAQEAQVADGQIAKSLDVRIPVDEGVERQFTSHEVYIDDEGVIYDASLNQTNATNNNNKFYRVQV